MRQQVEGLYQGTLQDWAAEVHRVKVAAEVERHKDELGHWKQVAEEAERELRDEIVNTQRQQEERENELREQQEAKQVAECSHRPEISSKSQRMVRQMRQRETHGGREKADGKRAACVRCGCAGI